MRNIDSQVFAWLVAALCMAGCSRDSVWKPSLENPDASQPPSVAESMPVEKMAPGDVIVWVNGAQLTRAGLDMRLQQIVWQLGHSTKPLRPQEMARAYRTFGSRVIPDFVDEQLLAQEARNRKLMTIDVLLEKLVKAKQQMAKAFGLSRGKLAKAYPGGERGLDETLEPFLWKKELLPLIPPSAEVDYLSTSNFYNQIASMNAEATRSNEVNRAKLVRWREDIRAGKISFEDCAERHSECPFRNSTGGGYWGLFERSDFNEQMGNGAFAPVFDHEPDYISEVLEDCNGYSIVKIIGYQDEKAAKSLKNRNSTVLKLARIFQPKRPLLIQEPIETLKANMMQQMTQQGVEEFTGKLREKAVIVYPHGSNFWATAKSDRTAASKKAKKAKKTIKESGAKKPDGK